jgi:hypothetical protein
MDRLAQFRRKLPKHTYVSCWHLSPFESAALWRIYGQVDEAVAVRSTYNRLIRSFDHHPQDIFVGTVTYVDYDNQFVPEGNMFAAFLHKRRTFSYESELRAVIQDLPLNADDQIDLNLEPTTPGISVPVALEVLIEGIYVAPTAPEWFASLIEKVVRRYDLEVPVHHSDLANAPVY